MKLSVAILTGGKSSRMGQDKALLKVNNDTFLDRLIKEFSSFDEVIVSQASEEDCFLWGQQKRTALPVEISDSSSDNKESQNSTAISKVRNVFDVNKNIGPIEGIKQSLKMANCQYVFVCAVDMPFLTRELAEYMSGYVSSDYDAYVITDNEHVHTLCAIYSKRILPVIEQLISNGDYKLKLLLKQVRTKYISIEDSRFNKKLLDNVNTPCEYELVNSIEKSVEKTVDRLSPPLVFAVSGIKNSGKTTMIEGLIECFNKRNLTCSVIKHDCHGYIMDHEGTDTDRFYKMGASLTAIYNDDGYSVNSRKRVTSRELIEKYCDSDVIILEGAKDIEIPKLVLSAMGDASEYDYAPKVLAIATDRPAFGTNIYHRNDYEGICEMLLMSHRGLTLSDQGSDTFWSEV